MSKYTKTLTKGILAENPVLRLCLGTCPTLAVTTSVANGLGMGLAATAVLIGSNVVISLLRKVVPDKVRIPAYITIIAGFVTLVQMLVQAYLPAINDSLGLFLPLIVVNCIILGRAEAFASKNSVVLSALDGVGMGIGFTLALTLMGGIRELLGAGTLLGIPLLSQPMLIFVMAPGGFFVFGMLIAAANAITKKMGKKPVKKIGCEGCPNAAACGGTCENKEGDEQ